MLTETEYSIELAIISTLLNYEVLNEEELAYISSLELNKEDFRVIFHQNIIRAINYFKRLNMPIFEVAISEELQRRGLFNEKEWFRVMEANPLGLSLFKKYYEILKANNTKSLHRLF